MNRRTFIEGAGLIAGAAVVGIKNIPMNSKPKYKMGYQLYSIRDEMAKDPLATIRALKAMGYEDFEAYGYDDKERELTMGMLQQILKKILDDLDLNNDELPLWFSPFLDASDAVLERFVDSCIKGALAMDSKYITWPWIAPEQRTIENFKIMAGKLNAIGAQVTSAGLGFAYHNHGFEFRGS